jgi:CheY-like chemotaxis protein
LSFLQPSGILGHRSLVPALAAIPVVITTALGIASEEWAASLGACGLLKKPFDQDTVLAEVRRCLAARARQTPCRVLVIEDQPEERFLLGLFLESHGFHVEEAADGRQGLRRALAWQPEVAVVDIDLPLLNGYEVARQLKAALGSRIRLIALTAYGQPANQQRAAEAGFDLHLTKPADPVEIVRHFQAAYGRPDCFATTSPESSRAGRCRPWCLWLRPPGRRPWQLAGGLP